MSNDPEGIRMATYDGTVEQGHQRAEDANIGRSGDVPAELVPRDGRESVVVRVPLPEGFVANPLTGEVIDLANASDEELAQFLEGLEDSRVAIQDAKRVVSQEALRRMDQAASWTLRAGALQLRAPSPEPTTEYDGGQLMEDLLTLVDEGVLTIDAVNAAVETEVSYKVRKGAVGKLLKLGGRVAEAVQRNAFQTERKRYVSVKRAGRP